MFGKDKKQPVERKPIFDARKEKFPLTSLDLEGDITASDTKGITINSPVHTVEEKPEIGFYPRFLWLEDRLRDIDHAMNRRIAACQHIPVEWINQRNEVLKMIGDKRYDSI